MLVCRRWRDFRSLWFPSFAMHQRLLEQLEDQGKTTETVNYAHRGASPHAKAASAGSAVLLVFSRCWACVRCRNWKASRIVAARDASGIGEPVDAAFSAHNPLRTRAGSNPRLPSPKPRPAQVYCLHSLRIFSPAVTVCVACCYSSISLACSCVHSLVAFAQGSPYFSHCVCVCSCEIIPHP